MVVSSKNHEYTFVANPPTIAPNAHEFVNFALKYHGNAWTTAAACTLSWRRSNHVAGGEIAVGFPKRWLLGEGYWKTEGDKTCRNERRKMLATAFYIATHAIPVHSVLALMMPLDPAHWVHLDPSSGCIWDWEMGASTVPMKPRT
ncbi:unnamed protein product [Didymodactylos carnosus]|uniref:Uncharacterized protein n=1 Tax=Didymodactylos carnosus TaxID=1234261 RepID=A0A815RPB7_9BILA|nr:unnamed protein product [Didymodactylos carnosus]CAF1479973.1 unnamed protein product [Didymodactylos carnosus]CAF4146176.1 unnamed protein product [Didymodactylos carnosus]CAF4345265.1 unnamed protein product [Didymodactylos carnosus]